MPGMPLQPANGHATDMSSLTQGLTATYPTTGGESSAVVTIDQISRYSDEEPKKSTKRLAIAEIYPERAPRSQELATAHRLLTGVSALLADALEALRNDEDIGADECVQQVHTLLPELFCCRTIGDGFGAVINGVLCALDNRRGAPLNRSQILACRRVLASVQEEPLMGIDRAIEVLSTLEDATLEIDPKGLADVLGDWLDG